MAWRELTKHWDARRINSEKIFILVFSSTNTLLLQFIRSLLCITNLESERYEFVWIITRVIFAFRTLKQSPAHPPPTSVPNSANYLVKLIHVSLSINCANGSREAPLIFAQHGQTIFVPSLSIYTLLQMNQPNIDMKIVDDYVRQASFAYRHVFNATENRSLLPSARLQQYDIRQCISHQHRMSICLSNYLHYWISTIQTVFDSIRLISSSVSLNITTVRGHMSFEH